MYTFGTAARSAPFCVAPERSDGFIVGTGIVRFVATSGLLFFVGTPRVEVSLSLPERVALADCRSYEIECVDFKVRLLLFRQLA